MRTTLPVLLLLVIATVPANGAILIKVTGSLQASQDVLGIAGSPVEFTFIASETPSAVFLNEFEDNQWTYTEYPVIDASVTIGGTAPYAGQYGLNPGMPFPAAIFTDNLHELNLPFYRTDHFGTSGVDFLFTRPDFPFTLALGLFPIRIRTGSVDTFSQGPLVPVPYPLPVDESRVVTAIEPPSPGFDISPFVRFYIPDTMAVGDYTLANPRFIAIPESSSMSLVAAMLAIGGITLRRGRR